MNQSLSHIDSGVTSLSALRGNHEIHLYYPAEGFGAIYRRVMMNDFFANLIRCTNIQTVAEVPVDSYGVAGAGSLVFAELGCEVTLISEDRTVLDRAQDLMEFNGVSNVRYLQSTFKSIPVPPDTFDFTWSFDRVQALPDPNAFLQELARVSKAAMVAVPNVHNYGQYAHAIYHRLTGTACEFVGPRKWMLRRPIREALEAVG